MLFAPRGTFKRLRGFRYDGLLILQAVYRPVTAAAGPSYAEDAVANGKQSLPQYTAPLAASFDTNRGGLAQEQPQSPARWKYSRPRQRL